MSKQKSYNIKTLFPDQTILTDANGAYYINLVDAQSFTSIELTEPGAGSERVSYILDNVSGTMSVNVDFGVNQGEFGSDARNVEYNTLETVGAADTGVTKYTLVNSGNHSWYECPGNSFHIRIVQTGTQTNKLYLNLVRLLEN